MPTESVGTSQCARCGAIRSDDWMADVNGKSYCLPNGSVGSPGNVDHRPKRTRLPVIESSEMEDRIRDAWFATTSQDRVLGMEWYDVARATAVALASGTPLTVEQTAGVLAAVSPKTQWSVAIKWAGQLVQAYLDGMPCPLVALPENRRRAWVILSGEIHPELILSGPKVEAFYKNIMGDFMAVTVDRWAIRIATGRTQQVSRSMCNRIAAAYQHVAKEVGALPAEVQAATWVHVRGGAS